MICRCVIFGGQPGYVPVREEHPGFTITHYVPCPDCAGTGRIHCCEGDRAQPEPEDKRDD